MITAAIFTESLKKNITVPQKNTGESSPPFTQL